MNALALLVILVIIGLTVYYVFVNVPEKTTQETQETEVIEATNEEEAAEKYLEGQLDNISLSDEDLEQLLLSVQS